MPVVLRAGGAEFDVDRYSAGSPLPVCACHRRGEITRGGRVLAASCVSIDVSDVDFDDLAKQIADAIRFFHTYNLPLRRLMSAPGVEDLTLDFGVARRDVAVQCDRLPAELVQLCGRYGMGIEMSYYPPLDSVEAG
jgi:hypothetical protein